MVDPSLFTGRYDDGLCAALAAAGHDTTLFGRPMRATDAIVPTGYRYVPQFFRIGEAVGRRVGEGRAFRAIKAAEYAVGSRLTSVAGMAADAVHWQWLPFPAADAQWLRRIGAGSPLVHTVHNADAFHGDGARDLRGRGYHALLGRFDALIVHVEATREALIARGTDPARIHVVPHPPMRLALADDVVMADVPAPRAPRILFFGTIRPYKGVDILIDAALALWRAGHVFELALAGRPSIDLDALLAPVRADGFGDRLIVDAGFLPEQRLDAHLRRADILVFPYRHIDASGALLSALHYGKPVVASDTGLFAQIAARPESPILSFAVGDPAALAAALLPLIGDPAMRREFGARAMALDSALGNWEDTAMRTIAVYEAARRHWLDKRGH